MSNTNVGEYGQTLRFNVLYDISAAVITLSFYPPNSDGVDKTVTEGVVVPNTPITVDGVTLNANEYAEYIIEQGLLSKTGKWRVRLTATFSNPDKNFKTDFKTLEVLA
jgi:hypothetical protein